MGIHGVDEPQFTQPFSCVWAFKLFPVLCSYKQTAVVNNFWYMGFPGGSVGRELTCNVGDLGSIPGLKENPLEKQMAIHSGIPAWRIPWTLHHARPPCPSPTPRVYSNSCPLNKWCHPTISPSIIPFSTHLQSFPASRSFQMSQLFASGDQSLGVSASTLVLPMSTQDWSPLGWTGWIFLQSKGLSRVFSNTTVQKHQFLSAQLSL